MSTETKSGAPAAQAAPSGGAEGGAHASVDVVRELQIHEPHRVGLPPLIPYLREAWRRREFAIELARNNLRAQAYGTVFGQVWLVLNPILMAMVYFALIDIIRQGHRPPNFLPHLVACIFAYHFVTIAVRRGIRSVVGSGKLILNTAFPRILLPLSAVLVSLSQFLPTLVIYAILHVAFGLPIGVTLLWVIPIIAMFAVIAAGVTMIVAAVQVYFRDLSSFLPFAIRLWLYTSPILYFPNHMPHGFSLLLVINPLGKPLQMWSNVLIEGAVPSVHELAIGCAWAVFLFVAGFLFFVSREREFAVRL